jgi:hypothetical protein
VSGAPLGAPACADDAVPAPSGASTGASALPTDGALIDVKRVERPSEEEPTLRFLRENRDFVRAQLDQLRQLARRGRDGDAVPLDARYLMFREMLQAIRASSDSTLAARDGIARRDLLASVGEIVVLESEVDAIEDRLARQGERLAQIEADFVGRQETALVILVKGRPAGGAPSAIVVRDPDGETARLALPPDVAAALERGGVAQALHAFVEPREHRLEVRVEGDGWAGDAPALLTLAPERDRLTFLELDLAGLDPSHGASGIRTSVWVK